MPPTDVFGFGVNPSPDEEPNPDWYDSVDEFREELAGETVDVTVLVRTLTHRLIAEVDLLLDGDLGERSTYYCFTEPTVEEFETFTRNCNRLPAAEYELLALRTFDRPKATNSVTMVRNPAGGRSGETIQLTTETATTPLRVLLLSRKR